MEDSGGAPLTVPAALAMVGDLAGDLAPPPRTSGKAPAASAGLPNGCVGLPKQPPEAASRATYPPGKGKTRPPFPGIFLPDHRSAVPGRLMSKRQTLPCPSPTPGKDRGRTPVELAIPAAQQPKWVAAKLRTRSQDEPGCRPSPSKSNMKQPARGRGRQKFKSAAQKTCSHAPERGRDTFKPPGASANAKPSSSAEQTREQLANRQFWKRAGNSSPPSHTLRTGSERPPASSARVPKQLPKSATDVDELLSRLRKELKSDPPADQTPSGAEAAAAGQHRSPTKRKGLTSAAGQDPKHAGKHPAGKVRQATVQKDSPGQGKRLKRAPNSHKAPAASTAAPSRQRPAPAQEAEQAQLPPGDAGQAAAQGNAADQGQGTGRPEYAEAILAIPRKLGQKEMRSMQVSAAPLSPESPLLHAWAQFQRSFTSALCWC